MPTNNLDYEKIGQRVKEARKVLGAKQMEIAFDVDISPEHMSHIETGKTKVSLPTLMSIVDALSVTPNDLLCDNFEAAKDTYIQKIAEELKDCSAAELEGILEVVRVVLKVMRQNQNDTTK